MTSAKALARTGMLTLAWLAILPILTMLLGAMVPVVPWLRIVASDIVPNWISWFLLGALIVGMLGGLAHRARATRVTLALMATAAGTALAAGIVMIHLLQVAWANGARIDLPSTLSVREFSEAASPDRSLVYARRQGEALWLDVYRPADAQTGPRRPVLVVVHGGGFIEGSRRVGAANMRRYADSGWIVVSIDYRLARPDRPTWNLATRDVRCALRWVAAHARGLHADADRVTLFGVSAGGNLAMAAAYTNDDGAGDARCGSRTPSIAAVIVKAPLISPLASWQRKGELQGQQRLYMSRYIGGPPERYPERYAALDLRRLSTPGNPPTLILAGKNDPLLPAASVEDFARRSMAAGNAVDLVMLPYSGHNFNMTFNSITNQLSIATITRFMNRYSRVPNSVAGRSICPPNGVEGRQCSVSATTSNS